MIIPVVGAVAAGKTTFSTALGSKLGIPVLRIDDHHRAPSEIYSCPEAWADLIEQMRDTPEPYIVESSATPDVYLDELEGRECFSVCVECSREARFQRLIDRGYTPEFVNRFIGTGYCHAPRFHVDAAVDGTRDASESVSVVARKIGEWSAEAVTTEVERVHGGKTRVLARRVPHKSYGDTIAVVDWRGAVRPSVVIQVGKDKASDPIPLDLLEAALDARRNWQGS